MQPLVIYLVLNAVILATNGLLSSHRARSHITHSETEADASLFRRKSQALLRYAI